MVDKKNNTSKNADTMIDPWNQDPFEYKILVDFRACLSMLIKEARWCVPYNHDKVCELIADIAFDMKQFMTPSTRKQYNEDINDAIYRINQVFFDGDPTIPSCYDDRGKLSSIAYFGTIDHILIWIHHNFEKFYEYVDDETGENLVKLLDRVENLSSEISDLADKYIG